MAWRIYRSTDAGAPVLTGQAGSLVALLDAVLVNGYGSGGDAKVGAGWSKTHTGTSKAVFRAGAAARARFFVRVDNTTRTASLVCYETMADVDTGGGRFPAEAEQPNSSIAVLASGTSDSTARAWVIFADDRTAILLIQNGGTTTHGTQYTSAWTVTTFGEFASFKSNDAYQFAIAGGKTNGIDTAILYQESIAGTASLASNGGIYVARDHQGIPGSKQCGIVMPNVAGLSANSPGAAIVGTWGAVNPADVKLWMMPIALRHWTETTRCLRGYLRGIRWALHNVASYADHDTMTDGEGLSWTYFRSRTGFTTVFGEAYNYEAGIWIANELPPTT